MNDLLELSMSNAELWSLSILGILMSVALSLVIIRLLNQERAKQGQAVQQANESKATQLLGLEESLKVMSTLVIDQQVEISEACMRIKVLLDHYDASLHDDSRFEVFAQVYGELEHMPTHQARKQTNKKFLFKLDQQRFEVERRYEAAVRSGAEELLKLL